MSSSGRPEAAASGRSSASNGSRRNPNSTYRDPYVLVDDENANEQTGLLGHNTLNGADKDSSWAGFEDFAGLPWWNTPSVYWLVGPFFLFTLAFGGSLVPKLNLIVDLVCHKYLSDKSLADPTYTFNPVLLGGENPQCKIPEVQKLVAKFMLYMNVTIGILSALSAPKLGALSDRYGRKKLITISSMGGICNEIVTILAAKYPETISYQWLILGSVFDGLAGSFTAGTVLSHSYTSDCTPPSKRGVAIGYLHACIFTGLALGPLLAGYFVEMTGSLVSVFYVTLGCHLFFIIFVLAITPESLTKKKQMLAREKHRDEQAALQDAGWVSRFFGGSTNPLAPLRILAPPGRENGPIRRNMFALAVCDFVILGGAMASGTIVLLYSELTFGWSNLETSKFVSLISTVRVFVLMAIFPLLSWFFRTRPMKKAREKALAAQQEQNARSTADVVNENLISDDLPEEHAAALEPETNAGADNLDIWLIRTAIISDMLGAVGYLLVRTPALFYASGAVTAFGGIGSATIQASVTKHVPPQRVGQLLGAMGLLHAIARVVAPILFNGLYAATVKTFPQAFFVLLLSLLGAAFLASLLMRPHVFIPESQEDDQDEESSPLLHPATPTAETLLEEDALLS
ncbi:hypothetical protein MKZ38_002071 [Zalerion maritima]|uniref:Major facilitator superfamily (MFS) profile domain-containing protein n=1 Tax=Zalerion maritima TaxID=339359 RepID=A0AAD5RXA6_9PEZI|nr:hypothetical protein MKZ38_002071 [Zalerion maritima]